MTFPYEQRFRRYLQNDKLLAPVTADDLCHDVSDLFNYLRTFNESYRTKASLSVLEESDISEYLIMLQTKRQIKNTTYNKVLTHLNTYFKFLFKYKLSTSLPTVTLQGQPRQQAEITDLYGWEDELPAYLELTAISSYTKMLLLLLAHFYPITEMTAPNFQGSLAKEHWAKFEQAFLKRFAQELEPRQKMQQCSDLFLKQRVDLAAPRLSVAGLHKILKRDQPQINLPLAPRKLYQAAILRCLNETQNLTDDQLCQKMRFDYASLNYYRTLAAKLRS
ncbi:integrase [Ligilactobacillus salitolerans]|uniref:Integrase n=1 Tax=Ligilactobacillus salitolerans TaxID=1808352 RepID=A0A401ITL2_9LACO|nr:site-specific integrase [Ligilactobacillus salitolerans]GBG94864.1 integrase [Ligilactobacillus salitolerans]